MEAYVEGVVCRELERLAGTYTAVCDSGSLADALAALEEAREDLELMSSDRSARRRLGGMWLSFVEPLVEAVQTAEERVQRLRASQQSPSLSGLTADAFRSLDRGERAAVLGAMIGCVFVRNVGGPRGPQAIPIDERRVRILWRGQEPGDLPARNKVAEIIPWIGFEMKTAAGVATS